MALYLLKAGRPDHLADAPGGDAFLTADAAALDNGRTIFAETCARCHSSKLPEIGLRGDARRLLGARLPAVLEPLLGADQDRRLQGRRCARSSQTDDFLDGQLPVERAAHPRDAAAKPTRAARWRPTRSPATSGTTSRRTTYKELPSVGTITVHHPVTGEPYEYEMPAGGRGYTRVPSLVRLWSTAPYLLNNRVGRFVNDPSVEGRMRAFQDGIEQMLWPERRSEGRRAGRQGAGHDRPRDRAELPDDPARLPARLPGASLFEPFRDDLPWLFDADGDIRAGADPAGHAGRAARQPRPAPGPGRPAGADRARLQARSSCSSASSATSSDLPDGRQRRRRRAPPSPMSSSRCWSSASARTSSSTAATTSGRT